MQGSTARYAEKIAEKAGATMNQISGAAQQTVDRVTDAASQAAQRLGEHTDELWELQQRAMESTRSYVREHPIAAIGIAIGVGLLLARLTSRH
jgi:ElaB/YqjD/DUF883 family membrane-anchored ribosome-binding protein